MDRCDPQETSISNLRGHILHSEGWLAGYIKDIIAYPPELLNFFEQVIAGSFEDIFQQILGADPFWATEIARRFANGNLTPQEAEALRKLLLAIRVKGGTTTMMMKKLMIAIMNFLVTRDGIDIDQANELVPGTIETLRDDYMSSSVDDYKSGDSTSRLGAAGALLLVLKNGCLDQDEVKKVEEAYPLPHLDMVAAHHELVEHQPKKLKEKLSKFIPKLLSLHGGSSKGGITNCLMKKLNTAIMNFLVTHDEISPEEATKLVPETIETLRENYMSDTEETYPAAEALLLTLEYNYLGKAETDRIKKSSPVTQLTMVSAHHELVEHQPNKLNEKLSKLVPNMLSLQRHRNELARIKSEEDAKLDDLTYLALALATHCDINNLHKDELTRELFKEANAQAVFDTMLESYNDNKDLLKAKLMIATPNIASDARNWSTFTAQGVAELQSTGLVGIRNIEEKIFIRSTKGKFADSKWKNCTIMYINGRRYTLFEDGMSLLKAAKNTDIITLTVLLSG